MKAIFFIFCFIFSAADASPLRFHRGINLSCWFQTESAQQIQINKYTEKDLQNIKKLGCDVIRLPINLHSMTGNPPLYRLDPLFINFLDQVVNMTEKLKIHLILDNHSFNPAVNTNPDIDKILIPVWSQLARHYKDRSSFLYYEILNEPHGIADKRWYDIQQDVIQAIRAIDTKHMIIVGPAQWNSYAELAEMPLYAETNLIYTFHFYEPFVFTHQGAGWIDPSMASLAHVPFPYNEDAMPVCPPELRNTWIDTRLQQYHRNGTVEKIKKKIDIAAAFKNKHQVPLFCGELGVYKPNSNPRDRIHWYKTVRQYLEKKGIAWTSWDYQHEFGLFERNSDEMFAYDLNIPLVRALGFNIPPQHKYIRTPETTGFALYKDRLEKNIVSSTWIEKGIVNYYCQDNPYGGRFCIHWTGVNQYNHISFTFKPVKDLSLLVKKKYMLAFWVKGDTPQTKFDMRFVDTKTSEPGDHPWRMRVTIDDTYATWDGKWHHVKIPLKNFHEHGSWDNEKWYKACGSFDWTAVKHFKIDAAYYDLTNIQYWFDNIRIIKKN
ncbi:MAG TPA: glycoside hydrolase family 5 protein [Spirochaetota bacterium]|nr:glycoside hydrolase family 5 protein [Spirochaetota bacterium]